MNSASLSLTFAIDQDEPAGTLESVLAIARRGGLSLSSLGFTDIGRHAQARMRLASHEAERLDLFLARLHNVIGVSAIVCGADAVQDVCVGASCTHA